MFAFLRRSFLILLGLLLIVVFIWYVGPYFSFARYSPLASENARLLAIGIVVGLWLVARLWKRLKSFRASDRLLAAVVAQPQPEAARLPADAAKLRQRFEEAVASLKQQRRGGHSLYDLPWYVIIGAPGSGKTTALLNSGLQFPLEQRVGKGALRGVGGTRNCDWWFTDEAIFLDTAGRYTTQDSDAASDSAGWTEFLALLKKYRARRPINGVILTINAQDLIAQGAAAREAHVDAARRRLDELKRELRIQLPVYLMVTKCDLVAGFTEYFDDLTPEGRAQVWGVTFPYDQTLRNDGPQVFPGEFDALMTRLNERVFARVEEVRDPRRRTRVFAFPQQIAAMRHVLTEFVAEVFDSSHFDRQILLRGVYFTSGTQVGTPIDRLLGSIAQRFGAAAAVAPASGQGRAYFVEQLLKDVLIGESGLAGINRGLEARKAAAQMGVYAATGLVAAAGVAGMSVSYNRNRGYLERTATEVARFEQTPAVNAAAPFDRMVTRLDAMRAIVDSANEYRDGTSLLMRWGLYQGGSIGNAARDAYVRQLDSLLLPRVAAQIRARLTRYASDPEKVYRYLRGYLMLGEPAHLVKDDVQALAEEDWSDGGTVSPAVGLALSKHFRALLDNAEVLRPLPLDGSLVAQARSSIRQASMPKILYDGIKQRYLADPQPGLRLTDLAGLEVEKVLTRRSGAALSAPMPRFYTREAFKEFSTEGRAYLLKEMTDNGWVWGDGALASFTNAPNLVSGVTNLYEADYNGAWDGLVNDLQFATFPTIAQMSEGLRILAAPSSPLKGVLKAIADQTTLVEPPKPSTSTSPSIFSSATQSAKEKFAAAAKPFQAAAGVAPVATGTLVTAHFSWVRQLRDGEEGKQPIDEILRSIGDIQRQLAALGPDAAGGDPVRILSDPSFRAVMETLRQQTLTLPVGLRTVVAQIGRGTGDIVRGEATNQVEQRYEQQVVQPCRQLIAGKYPFAGSPTEVSPEELGQVFGADGLFDSFFNRELQKLVDVSQTPWTWRAESVSPRHRMLEQFYDAQRIRDIFFKAGGKAPKIAFFVTTSDLDRDSTRYVLDLEGQPLEARPQAQQKRAVEWPGSIPARVVSGFESPRFEPRTYYAGKWAWFRMIDATRDPADSQRTLLNPRTMYHSVRISVEPSQESSNPFGSMWWRNFSCES